MVLIAGPSSSGKTTFAGKLCMALKIHGIKPVTISVDNYFVERENNPKDENGNYDFECLEALDLKLLNKQLKELLAGKKVTIPEYDFVAGKKKYDHDPVKLGENAIILMEGLHSINDAMTPDLDKDLKYKVY